MNDLIRNHGDMECSEIGGLKRPGDVAPALCLTNSGAFAQDIETQVMGGKFPQTAAGNDQFSTPALLFNADRFAVIVFADKLLIAFSIE